MYANVGICKLYYSQDIFVCQELCPEIVYSKNSAAVYIFYFYFLTKIYSLFYFSFISFFYKLFLFPYPIVVSLLLAEGVNCIQCEIFRTKTCKTTFHRTHFRRVKTTFKTTFNCLKAKFVHLFTLFYENTTFWRLFQQL
jgi:hypothetical protein